MPALGRLQPADLFVVAPTTLSPAVAAAVRRLAGVTAALPLDAARIDMDGKLTATLGVDPAAFRVFAARPTARATGLWQNVAAGGVALSYTMGKLDNVPMGRDVRVTGRKVEELPLAGLGTTGIGGVDAVVSDAVARSLGVPADNAIVISAPHADLSTLMRRIQKVLPKSAAVAPLVAQSASGDAVASGTAGASGATGSAGLSQAELIRFLTAAESRLGMPYVWGGNGPYDFDCSGLVQWSMAQAGVVMPRVAADQALTGPLIPVSQLAPGDLLFYHTDPTAPGYISHVAIYLGDGKMLQAPEPGLDVEVVPASFGSEFAGAIRVDPRVAAAVAADPAG
jgi:peptidoglycan DL-endopeptidase CwlO